MRPDANSGSVGSGRALLVASIGSGLIGVGVIVGAVALSPDAGNTAAARLPPPPVAPADVRGEVPVQTPTPDPHEEDDSPASIALLVDEGWATERAEALSIPVRPMVAYAGAALRMAQESPSCNVGWNTLAGIGHVESGHGSIDGNRIDDTGSTVPGVFGPTLNVAEYDIIHDTDDGDLDGDDVWDRAVGPLQFLPSTWTTWGVDGNGDGIADPQNIDDAAVTAARYLCDVGGDLSVSGNWLKAIWAYNGTNSYAVAVSEAARHYAR